MIGCGNMGTAIIGGMVKSGAVAANDVFVYDIARDKAEKNAKDFGIVLKSNIKETIEASDYVIVAVKPLDVEAMVAEHKSILDKQDKVVISIAAGLKAAVYRKHLAQALIVRAMPNTPMLAGEGATGLYFDGKFSAGQKDNVMKIFSSCGIAEEVAKEEHLDIVTGLSGSGPAYVYIFISAMVDAAVREGLPRDKAKKLASQTVLGAAKMTKEALAEGVHPEELKDRVMSPGGTTAAGLYALERGSFRADIMDAVRAAAQRSRELGG
ncbi:MAG: pyrroline-5-carboxylate reductase [Spirochaetes bacterium GWF1_51_8]|nr:MAG: pyrroline-5-carboxylate reductase [Spirochaetes bacterium GWF1_51_8]